MKTKHRQQVARFLVFFIVSFLFYCVANWVLYRNLFIVDFLLTSIVSCILLWGYEAIKVGIKHRKNRRQSKIGNITNAQKASFAIANKLADRLGEAGVSKEVLWDYIRSKFNVEKRNDMTEMQWTQLSAELKAAETTPKLFEELTKRIGESTEADTENDTHA